MKAKQAKLAIKTLKDMRKFYRRNPCDLDMITYNKCAMGTYLIHKKGITTFGDSGSILYVFKDLFDIHQVTSLNCWDVDYFTKGSLEREIINLFTTNVGQEIHSDEWRKQAKLVIERLENVH